VTIKVVAAAGKAQVSDKKLVKRRAKRVEWHMAVKRLKQEADSLYALERAKGFWR
jgi:hypothetical protein